MSFEFHFWLRMGWIGLIWCIWRICPWMIGRDWLLIHFDWRTSRWRRWNWNMRSSGRSHRLPWDWPPTARYPRPSDASARCSTSKVFSSSRLALLLLLLLLPPHPSRFHSSPNWPDWPSPPFSSFSCRPFRISRRNWDPCDWLRCTTARRLNPKWLLWQCSSNNIHNNINNNHSSSSSSSNNNNPKILYSQVLGARWRRNRDRPATVRVWTKRAGSPSHTRRVWPLLPAICSFSKAPAGLLTAVPEHSTASRISQ